VFFFLFERFILYLYFVFGFYMRYLCMARWRRGFGFALVVVVLY